jgi:hypothetical protein
MIDFGALNVLSTGFTAGIGVYPFHIPIIGGGEEKLQVRRPELVKWVKKKQCSFMKKRRWKK